MFGFLVEKLQFSDSDISHGFQGEESVVVGRYALSYSPVTSVHNCEFYEKNISPFVFICGEISNFDDFGFEQFDNDFAEYISILLKNGDVTVLGKLRGLFAIFAHDPWQNKVWIYSDCIGGFFTVYYSVEMDRFTCSTSFKNAVHGQKAVRVNAESLSRLISTGYVLPPNTLAEGVYKLRPGCLMIIEGGESREEQISVLPFETRAKAPHFAGEEYLLEYMEKYMTKDSCFLLSGGLDSSTLVAIAAKHFGRDIACCAGAFSGCGDLDESSYAKIVADHCSVDLHFIELGHDSVLRNLPEIVEAIGEPFLDDSILPTYAMFKEIKKSFDTVFSGDGPDHLFNRYYPLAAKRTIGFMLKRLPFLPEQNKYVDRLLRSSSDDIEFAYSELFTLPHWGHNRRDEILGLLHPSKKRQFDSSYMCKISGCRADMTHDRNLKCVNVADFYIDGSFGVFSKVGKAASALALHAREPYLASSFAEFAASMPMANKFRGGFFSQLMSRCTTKAHLRDKISKKYLPETIIKRKKGGFTPPLEIWLRDFLRHAHVQDYFSEISKCCLNMEQVDIMLRKFINDNVHGCLIFMLISFDLWVKIFVECHDVKGVLLDDIYR